MTPLRIAARLEYATLEQLEEGFAERLGEHELFLAHGSFGVEAMELRIGAGVVVEITTASGETGLALDGVIAWSYPPGCVPPGREAGTGIHIDRFHDGSELRAGRIRKRIGAGARVRAPGSRLKPPVVERTRPTPSAPRPLPASLFEIDAGSTSSPDAAEPPRSVPAPRLMGLALDQTFDPTPAPGPAPLPRELPADDLPAPIGPPRPPSSPRVSIDALSDLPSAVPGSVFEQVPTDVDLLRSVGDADLVSSDSERASFERRALVDVTGPRVAVLTPAEAPLAPAAGFSPTPARYAAELGPQAEPELVSDDDVSPVDEDSTGSHQVPTSILPSLDAADFQTAEHVAVAPLASPNAADWEGRTEHGIDPSEPTAEASDPDRTALPPRPLPTPTAWPEEEERSRRPIGVAYVVARRAPAPVGLEVLTWPQRGTKRISALDEAREQGGDKLDEAIASARWLARDPSADDPPAHDADQAFDAGLTDPGRHVLDVVGAMVRAAESEPEGGDVFSGSGPPEPATANPALDEPTVAEDLDAPAPASLRDEAATLVGDEVGEEAADGVQAAAPLLADDEQETDRVLRRPPTEASPATKSRLGVLQRFLGKR